MQDTIEILYLKDKSSDISTKTVAWKKDIDQIQNGAFFMGQPLVVG